MSLIKDKKLKDFFVNFEKLEINQYELDQLNGFLKKSAKKFNSEVETEKISRNTVRSNIIYENNIIGSLNGVSPSSTTNDIVAFSKNQKLILEYLDFQNIRFDNKTEVFLKVRVNIVEGQYVASSLILAPFIIGDGKLTIEELIAEKNNIRKSMLYFNKYLIKLDDEVVKELDNSNLKEHSIIPSGEVYILKHDYNIASGSETMDITNEISNEIVHKAMKTAASIPNLYSVGIDIVTDNYINPQTIKFGSLIVSPSPSRHYLPYKGESIELYDKYIPSLIVKYKINNDQELSDKENVIKKEMNEFDSMKDYYIEKISNSNLKSEKISENLFKYLNNVKNNNLIKRSILSRNIKKKELVIDEEIFKINDEGVNLNITKSNVLRLLKSRKDSVEMANLALQNEIVPFPGFESVTFDSLYYYTDKAKKYGSSYQLYIQSLRIVAVLLVEFEKSKNIRYLYKAEEIIYSWISFVSKGTDEPMVWYDHPTANRVQVLVHFLYLAQNEKLEVDHILFRAILKKHGEILANDDIYINNNHGLMMDKSLMILGNVLKEERFFIKGYYRSIDTFWYSFSPQGTHLENSPEYHNMVVRMYEELQKYLVNNNETYSGHILEYLEISKSYLNIIIKPNSKLPPIGDSSNILRNLKKTYENFYDKEAGIAVLQYSDKKPFYLNFICGYSSKTHKHKDDLSLNLNYNGEDFLTDAGKFNYNGKSSIRKYVISQKAHSSFQLKNHDYQLNSKNRFDRKITLNGYNYTEDLSIVKGKNAGYTTKEIVLNRLVMQIKNIPIVIIYDYVDNEKGIKYEFVQNFNLSSTINAKKKRKHYQLSGEKESLVIKQLLKLNKSEIIQGDKDIPIAVNATDFSKVIESSQVKYHRSTVAKDVFLTAIYDENVIKDVTLITIDSKISLKINGEIYTVNI